MSEYDQIERVRTLFQERLNRKFKQQDRRMTYVEISHEVGIGSTAVGLYLRGRVMEAQFSTLLKFLEWLDVEPNELAAVLREA